MADPGWKPADLAGRRVLVIGENGPGDEILTLGCLEELRSCCTEITWQCSPKLQPLFCQCFPEVRFISAPEVASDPELVVHSWQLIGRFRPSLESFPWTASGRFSPYLHGQQPEHRKAALPRIGLAWHSERGRRGKSCDLDRIPGWAEFFCALRGRVQLISLQHGDTPQALQAVQDAIQAVKDLYGVDIYQDPSVDTFNDFCSLATQVAGLDYVVSISTTVTHLIGALGVPGWVLLPDDPIPHWDAGKHVCVWYPTLMPMRHEKPGDWDSAIARVSQQLVAKLNQATARDHG